MAGFCKKFELDHRRFVTTTVKLLVFKMWCFSPHTSDPIIFLDKMSFSARGLHLQLCGRDINMSSFLAAQCSSRSLVVSPSVHQFRISSFSRWGKVRASLPLQNPRLFQSIWINTNSISKDGLCGKLYLNLYRFCECVSAKLLGLFQTRQPWQPMPWTWALGLAPLIQIHLVLGSTGPSPNPPPLQDYQVPWRYVFLLYFTAFKICSPQKW